VFTAAEADRFIAEHPLAVTSEPLSAARSTVAAEAVKAS
jgi:hypothetical protein